MRADAHNYQLIHPPTLRDALAILSEREYTPIAGGTELMVALAAGRLPLRPLLSIQLKELRYIQADPDEIIIGAGSTFSDLRTHPVVAEEFPLLSQAAAWIGSIANQNRATIGGNIVNASPAADSSPPLLVYEATLVLISATTERTINYSEFHQGYKTTELRPDELVYSVHLKRSRISYQGYLKKVGTRNAQAISKVAFAGLAWVEGGILQDIRLAAASLKEVPTRLRLTERSLTGTQIDETALRRGRAALLSEVRPIDDIRSTALYRNAVAANLLEEFLRSLKGSR